MAIDGYDHESFGRKINSLLSPAQPVRTIEHLFGRQKELDRIKKASEKMAKRQQHKTDTSTTDTIVKESNEF